MGTDLLALRKKSKVTEIINEVAKNERFVPLNSLPGWDELPLGDKLPNHENPISQAGFSRAKLGQKLYHLPKKYFDVTDTNVSLEYEPLHDVTLQQYFNRDPTLKALKSHGLVDDNDDVKCSLKDFNAYRRYLYDAHLSRYHKQRLDKDKRRMEKLYFKMAQKYAENIKKGCHRERKFAETRATIMQATEERHQANMRKLAVKLDRSQKKCANIQKVSTTESSAEYIKNRRLKEIRARLELQEKLEKKEGLRLRNIQQRDESIKQTSHEKSMQCWNEKLEKIRKNLERNEEILEQAEEEMAANVEKRHAMVNQKWCLLEMEKMKTKSIFIRNRYDNSSTKRFIRIMCDEFRRLVQLEDIKLNESYNLERNGLSPLVAGSYNDKGHIYFRIIKYPVPITKEIVTRAVQIGMDINQIIWEHDYSFLDVIYIAKQIIFHIASGISEEVPTDQYVIAFVKENIRLIIEHTTDQILHMIKNDLIRERDQKLEQRRPSLFSVASGRKSIISMGPGARNTRGVRFNNAKSTSQGKKDEMYASGTSMTERTINLRSMIRTEFETEYDNDEYPFAAYFNSPEIFHITPKQKIMIKDKLTLYHSNLSKRTERLVFRQIDLKSQSIIKRSKVPPQQANKNTIAELIQNSATAILMPSLNNHTYSAKTVVDLSDRLFESILDSTAAMIKEIRYL